MSDGSSTKGLRERLANSTEDRLGKALEDLLENPLLTGALGRAFDAREKASQAQELAMGALNIPSASDLERLTRRLRSVSQRLEGIEDGVHRLDRTLSSNSVDARLSAIEAQLGKLTDALLAAPKPTTAPKRPASKPAARRPAAAKASPRSREVKPKG
jgi:hypothetical protein